MLHTLGGVLNAMLVVSMFFSIIPIIPVYKPYDPLCYGFKDATLMLFGVQIVIDFRARSWHYSGF